MANNCYFDLHVTCKNSDGVLAVLEGFGIEETSNNENSLGGIYTASCYEKGHHKTKANGYGDYFAYIDGDCKWSVQSAILDKGRLQELIQKYKLDVEIYSEEPGVGFMEHYRWEEGELIISEETKFALIHIDDVEDYPECADDFFDMQIVKDAYITKENYQSFADSDGYIKVGGFDYNWVIN